MTAVAKPRRKEEVFVDLLVTAGLAKNVARTLVFLARREVTTSVDIEKATGLRQPEVSLAMAVLRKRGWIEKHDLKKEGKGRPVHAYRLAMPLEGIVDTIAGDERRKIEAIEDNLRKLQQGL